MKENVILNKTYAFALKIIKVYKILAFEKKEYVLSKQLLKCGTSVGANVEESTGGQSRKDFFTKITIAYKEARETNYWIRLLRDSGFLEKEMALNLIKDCDELLRILGAIQITVKKKQNISG